MDDIEKVARANCRGSWQLGTACGKCPRCESTRPTIDSGMDAATARKVPLVAAPLRAQQKDTNA